MIRRIHWPLFLLALAIALVIKVAVLETEQLIEKTVEAKVNYSRPEDVTIVDRIKEVEVRLRGPRSDVTQLNPLFVEVFVEVEPDQIGLVPVLLQRSDVRTPGELEVLSIEPQSFNIQVERVESAVVPVIPELVGEPAAGARPGEPIVRPGWVDISGPASRVRRLRQLKAVISVERRALSFEETVPVVTEDPQIVVQPPRVLVTVPMKAPQLSTPLDELENDDDSSDDSVEDAGTP